MTNQYSYAESFSVSKNELPQKKIPESNISSAAKVYMLSRMKDGGEAKNYRNGNDNGQKYMTGEDFVTYFQSRGKITVRPENVAKSTVSNAEIHRSRASVSGESAARYGKATPKASYGAPNVAETVKIYKPAPKKAKTDADVKVFDRNDDDVKIYTPKRSGDVKITDDKTLRFEPARSRRGEATAVFSKVDNEKLSKLKKVANEWLPEDKIIDVKKDKKKNTRSFSKVILAMAGALVSLMLIVSGSVLISGANSEVKKLENELGELKAEEKELSLELEMKNDVNVLLDRATGDLGMIRKEYVEANYLDMSGNDSIEAHEEEKDENVGIAAILSAFGIGN